MEPRGAPRVFADAKALRAWFAKHAATQSELWIKFYKVGSPRRSVRYPEALDEALCVGWIDGLVRGIDEECYMQRWTPRRKGSNWSAVNVAKAEALIASGRMKKSGLEAFEARDKGASALYSFENAPQPLPPDMERALRADSAAWAFWQKQPLSYRKVATWLVVSAKREETRQRRFRLVLEHAARGERIPQLVPTGARGVKAKGASKPKADAKGTAKAKTSRAKKRA